MLSRPSHDSHVHIPSISVYFQRTARRQALRDRRYCYMSIPFQRRFTAKHQTATAATKAFKPKLWSGYGEDMPQAIELVAGPYQSSPVSGKTLRLQVMGSTFKSANVGGRQHPHGTRPIAHDHTFCPGTVLLGSTHLALFSALLPVRIFIFFSGQRDPQRPPQVCHHFPFIQAPLRFSRPISISGSSTPSGTATTATTATAAASTKGNPTKTGLQPRERSCPGYLGEESS
jgi:hypothetical protein